MKWRNDHTIGLEPGKPIVRELGGTDVHRYVVRLEKGSFLQGNAEQKGIDVVVTVFDPNRKKLGVFDGPTGAHGPEPFHVKPRITGIYRIQVTACDTSAVPSKYEISISEPLTPKQQAAHLATERLRAEAVSNWFASKAIRLNTVEAGHSFADLQPLRKVIGDARIVALGEATHGTREFFQLKHRMFEFLVSEMGFTAFGIEAAMPECCDINDYVLSGKGDPAKALAGQGSRIWDTKEVLAVIEWMRGYNADPSHARKIGFYGFDMWHPARAARVTRDYLRRVDPKFADSVAAELGLLANPVASNAPDLATLPADRKLSRLAAIQSVLARFDAHEEDFVRNSSREEWTLTRQHARVLAQFAQSGCADNLVRDPAMAENAAWILEQEGPKSKIVLWAHNSHLGVHSAGDWTSMGYHLRRQFGPALYVFGLAFSRGSFYGFDMRPGRAGGLHSIALRSAARGTLEDLMARAGLAIAALNLRDLPADGPIAEWSIGPCLTRTIGGFYPVPQEYESLNARKTYDGVLFVSRASAARPLSLPSRSPPPKLRAPANLDFERTTGRGRSGRPGLPVGWTSPVRKLCKFDFRVASSNEKPYHGKRCVEISRPAGRHYGEAAGTISQSIRAGAYRGKTLRLRAAVRAEVSGAGNQAQLWLRGTRPMAAYTYPIAFFDCMFDRPITSPDWRIYEITAEVGSDVETIDYGLALVGDGKAWLDAVSIEAV